MLYNEICKYVKGVEQFRGRTTIKTIKLIPINTRNEKMNAIIYLKKLINGLGIRITDMSINKSMKFNESLYRQKISDAISNSNKPQIVGGYFFAMMKYLIQDLIIEFPNNHDTELFKKCLDAGVGEDKLIDFDEFFNGKLTETQKDDIKDIMNNGGPTGQTDLDWKIANIKIISEKDEYNIPNRYQFLLIKNEELHRIYKEQLKMGQVSEELQFLYEHMDDIDGRQKRSLLQNIVIALLFKQPYDKYEQLVVKYKYIKELLERKA